MLAYLFAVALTAPIGLALVLVAPGMLLAEILGQAEMGRLISPFSVGSSALFFALLALLYRTRRRLALGLGLAATASGLAVAYGEGLRVLGGP
jgi:hypothetical protein